MSQGTTLAELLFTVALGCAPAATAGGHPVSDESARLDRLIQALDTVQGEFRDVADLTYVFDSDSRVLEDIAAYNKVAVPRLVECLGRTHRVRATADYAGPLRLGVLCNEALASTDYFQERITAEKWLADTVALTFTATPEELHRVQRIWRAYLKQHPLTP
jgi:hypothetical protein